MAARIRVNVPPIPPTPPSAVAAGEDETTLAPTAPQDAGTTHDIGIPDVSDQTLMEYMKIKPNPNEAMMHARLDALWRQVAREYDILNGDPKHDYALWQDHQLFMQGATDEDPIMHDDLARDEFLRRIGEVIFRQGR